MRFKTKLYTKKEIQEAISFWTKILENKSPLIDALVEDFGYDVVFGRKKIIPTLNIIKTIYSIVNTYLFDNALVQCPIRIDDTGQCAAVNAAMVYHCTTYGDRPHDPTRYILLREIG